MNPLSTLTPLAFVLALAFGVTAPRAASANEPPVLTIILKDHKFEPAEIEIPKDTKVKLVIKNEDPTPEEFESHELHREKVVAGGKEITVSIGPLKPGRYPFFGEFNPKTAQGAVIVKP